MCAFCRLATALIALLFGLVVPGAAQLSASWTPSGDGPLPLSENYRTTLRKLCKLELKDSLPPKVRSAFHHGQQSLAAGLCTRSEPPRVVGR